PPLVRSQPLDTPLALSSGRRDAALRIAAGLTRLIAELRGCQFAMLVDVDYLAMDSRTQRACGIRRKRVADCELIEPATGFVDARELGFLGHTLVAQFRRLLDKRSHHRTCHRTPVAG